MTTRAKRPRPPRDRNRATETLDTRGIVKALAAGVRPMREVTIRDSGCLWLVQVPMEAEFDILRIDNRIFLKHKDGNYRIASCWPILKEDVLHHRGNPGRRTKRVGSQFIPAGSP